MSSIVIDLQDEILSSDCDIVQILRRAHVIAVKLGLKEFDQWISYELFRTDRASDQRASLSHLAWKQWSASPSVR